MYYSMEKTLKENMYSLAYEIYANCAIQPTYKLQQLLFETAEVYKIMKHGKSSFLVLSQDLKGTSAYITAAIIYDEKDNMLECIKLIGG